jgi:hypothetical protein
MSNNSSTNNNNSEVVSLDDNHPPTDTTTTTTSTSNNNNSIDYELYCRREQAIDDLLAKIKSDNWGFQQQVDHKARSHLRFLMMDHFSKKKPKTSTSKTDGSITIDPKTIEKKLDRCVNKLFDEMMYEYGKWCSVAGRKNRIGKSTVDKATAMLLLLVVFGEIDLVRTQNHVCQMLFHLAFKLHLKLTKNPNLAKPFALPSPDNNNNESDDDKKNKKKKKSRPTATLSTIPVNSIGDIVVREAKYCYSLIKVHFNKNVMNEEFFDWDDLNDLSWTPGFVKNFFKRAEKDSAFSIGGFDRAFGMKNYPFIITLMNGGSVSYDDRDLLKKEKAIFNRTWKTYMDRAGGWLGIKGYITFFLTFYPQVYYQLICIAIANNGSAYAFGEIKHGQIPISPNTNLADSDTNRSFIIIET